MPKRTPHRQDPDTNRLFAELAEIVRVEIKDRGLSVKAACRQMTVPETSVQAFLNGHGITLDTFCALARWVGYELALTLAPTAGEPEQDAAIAAIMSGLADAYRHQANGAEVACHVLSALDVAGYHVSRSAGTPPKSSGE